MNLLDKLKESKESGKITEKIYKILCQLYDSYSSSLIADGISMEGPDKTFLFLLKRAEEQLIDPYQFSPYHKRITTPINYFKFAMDFTRPLVHLEESVVLQEENLTKMTKQVDAKENVILLANHQTEVDPQLINIMLEDKASTFASEMIFVAGDRVLTDPLATPFSMGCNLICIYSKRHIDNPPEKRAEKQLHNQRTMGRLRELLAEGGKCVYVAPAGGRDRPNDKGVVEVAKFDPQSIEMFRLIALKSKTPTHFYPLALVTYDILPPPQDIERELGEKRKTSRHRVLLSFGDEIDMEAIASIKELDRHKARERRSDYIENLVKTHYQKLKNL